MFSTAAATASSGVPGARRATVPMAAITVHAPILSIFISSIRSDGLMLIPPESKQTPLPTIARCRPSASFSPFPAGPHDDHPGRVVAALPDREEHAHAELPGAVGLDDVDPQAVLLGDGAGLVGEDLRADVVGRPIRQRPGVVRALADDDSALRGLVSPTRRRAPGATRISSSSSGGAVATSSR